MAFMELGKDLLKSYLSNRKLHCKIDSQTNTVKSDYYELNVGTPQGSVHGPLLFLNFVNDYIST